MAMTKKEREAMDAAIHKAELLAALRWTSSIKPDVPPPDVSSSRFGEISTGWEFNSHSMRISEAWSSSISHGAGSSRSDTASQGSRRLYSTKELAARAMRHEIELRCAGMLLDCDKAIAKSRECCHE